MFTLQGKRTLKNRKSVHLAGQKLFCLKLHLSTWNSSLKWKWNLMVWQFCAVENNIFQNQKNWDAPPKAEKWKETLGGKRHKKGKWMARALKTNCAFSYFQSRTNAMSSQNNPCWLLSSRDTLSSNLLIKILKATQIIYNFNSDERWHKSPSFTQQN